MNLDASWNLFASRIPGIRRLLHVLHLISETAATQDWSGKIRYCNVNNGLPFVAGEVAVVYASHMLEHLTRKQGQALLRECYRVLAPGGIVRLVVPDLERLARLYLERKAHAGLPERVPPADDMMQEMRTCPDYSEWPLPVRMFRLSMDAHSHKWMYDADSLSQALRLAGFKGLKQCRYLESRVPMIAGVERANRFEDGICIEGVK